MCNCWLTVCIVVVVLCVLLVVCIVVVVLCVLLLVVCIVVVLCVLLSSYVYLLYYVCTAVSYFRCRTAG